MNVSVAEWSRLTHYLPLLVRDRNVTDWERSFCSSLLARVRRGSFQPSIKQVSVLRRLVSDFQDRELRVVEDRPVMDRGAGGWT